MLQKGASRSTPTTGDRAVLKEGSLGPEAGGETEEPDSVVSKGIGVTCRFRPGLGREGKILWAVIFSS